ncbi:MAG: stage V sporulation protein AC [Lachnospira sp.]
MEKIDEIELGMDDKSKKEITNDIQKRNESYNAYVENVTPKASCVKNCLKAFITGGIICVVGQALLNFYIYLGLDKDNAALATTISLVFLSALLTGLGIYPLITTFGGAGSLVPITGFANSVAAPAIEFKKEGQVFGIGCKIFTIAGPVILYGIFFGWCAGLIYFVAKMTGII